jgi:hypothetical protein
LPTIKLLFVQSALRYHLQSLLKNFVPKRDKLVKTPIGLTLTWHSESVREPVAARASQNEVDTVVVKLRGNSQPNALLPGNHVIQGHQ